MDSIFPHGNANEEVRWKLKNGKLKVAFEMCSENDPIFPFFFASGHLPYAKSSQLYLQDMLKLKIDMDNESLSKETILQSEEQINFG